MIYNVKNEALWLSDTANLRYDRIQTKFPIAKILNNGLFVVNHKFNSFSTKKVSTCDSIQNSTDLKQSTIVQLKELQETFYKLHKNVTIDGLNNK